MAEKEDTNNGKPETANGANPRRLNLDWPNVGTRQHSPLFVSEEEEAQIAEWIKEGIRLVVPNYGDNKDSVFSKGNSKMKLKRGSESDVWVKGLLKFASSELLKYKGEEQMQKQKSGDPQAGPVGSKEFPQPSCSFQNLTNFNHPPKQISKYPGGTFNNGTFGPNFKAQTRPGVPGRFQNYKDSTILTKSDFKSSKKLMCQTAEAPVVNGRARGLTSTSDTSLPMNNTGSNINPVFGSSPNLNLMSARTGAIKKTTRVPATNAPQGDKTYEKNGNDIKPKEA